MGVVYRAEDTKLDRPVALKFLSAHLLGDDDVRKRFEREAKSAAALSHTNVCTVYEIDEVDGKTFIALELVEGKSLDKPIAKGPLKLDEALDIAQQVAKGLEAAHTRGIVHRDIKPENIMAGDDGHVTIMDFGLAQLNEASRLTKTDETVGTVAYMSPEQTDGSGADHRTDIWSLGVVLYEMVTGQQPFKGDYDKAVMYSILNEEPEPVTALRTGVPVQVEDCVGKCLAKDRENRYQHVGDLIVDLRALSERVSVESAKRPPPAPPPTSAQATARLPWAIAAVSVLAAISSFLANQPSDSPSGQFDVLPLTTYPGVESEPALSPDGESIAFIMAAPEGDSEVYVRLVDGSRPLRLTESPAVEDSPAWSPDGNQIAFGRGNEIFVIPALGGQARRVAELESVSNRPQRLSWSPDGRQIAVATGAGLTAVSLDGGEPVLLSQVEPPFRDYHPRYSPDGATLAFIRGSSGFSTELRTIDLVSGDVSKLVPAGNINGLDWLAGGAALVYSSSVGSRRVLHSIDFREGSSPIRIPAGSAVYPTTARASSRMAFVQLRQHSDIWSLPTDGSSEPTRIIASTGIDGFGRYSRDGSRIAFSAQRTGWQEIWRANADGSGQIRLTDMRGDLVGGPDWSPDDSQIVFATYKDGQSDLFLVSSEGGSPRRLTSSAANDSSASYSRDGEWISYMSDSTGRQEIWKIRPEGGEPVQLTDTGGRIPYVSRGGKDVFYLKRSGGVWKVPLDGGAETQVMASGVAGQQYAPGDNAIYYVSPANPQRSIVKFDTATGRRTTLSTLPPDVNAAGGRSVSVSPDGETLILSFGAPTRADLMLVEGFR